MTIRCALDNISVRHREKFPTLLGRNLSGEIWKLSEIILGEVRSHKELKQGKAGLCGGNDRHKTQEHRITGTSPWAEMNDKETIIWEAVGVEGGRGYTWLSGAWCSWGTLVQTFHQRTTQQEADEGEAPQTLHPEHPWGLGRKTSLFAYLYALVKLVKTLKWIWVSLTLISPLVWYWSGRNVTGI